MNHSNRLLMVVIIFATALSLWAVPPLIKMAIASPSSYPFVYYSSLLEELCEIDHQDRDYPMTDKSGRRYSVAQFDSLMPLFNYRQLMSNGTMPDSMRGVEITPSILRVNQVVFTHRPTDIHTPSLGLYGLLESMPLRVGLKSPKDLFRIEDRIEFIDATTNKIDHTKSDIFANMLSKRGYTYPSQWAIGDANTRKAYDEGYFSLDANGELFHIKMVNSRPYVRNTEVAKGINVKHFAMYPAADRRFYGFVFSVEGHVYILEGRDGEYIPLKLDIPNVNIDSDELLIMGNLFYWTVTITKPEREEYYALNAATLDLVDKYQIVQSKSLWSQVSDIILPIGISMSSPDSEYIYPRITLGGVKAWIVSSIIAAIFLLLNRKKGLKESVLKSGIITFTGIIGLIVVKLFPNFK